MKVLFVCTGNTCRSPMAEGYLKSKKICGLEASSCGIYTDGARVSQNSALAMSEIGIDISGHISKPADDNIFNADRIYCMSPSHRLALLALGVDENKLFVLGDGIPDPFGGDIKVYRLCRDSITSAIDLLIENGELGGFTVKEIDYTHIEQIAELERLCFSEPWSAEAITDSYRSGTLFFAAVIGKRLLGYVGIKPVLDEGYITNVAVFPEYRRMGVANALMKRLDRLAGEKLLSFISLEVRKSNIAAISLYEKLGYKGEGIRKNFYRCPLEDAIIMTKRFVSYENT